MKVSIKGFIYHKEAESFEDCFDRYAVNLRNNKFCVSDGVSKSFFPGLWAELLVETYVRNQKRISIEDNNLFKSIQKKWIEEVRAIVNRPNQKYFVKNFYAQGRSAAATFVGLDFLSDNGKLYWEALALGDSFLFYIPKNVKNLNYQFSDVTYLSSKKNFEFDNFPDFFDSIDSINKGKIKYLKQELKPGRFFLMTDALSEWFINEKQGAIDEIMSWISQSHFEERISYLRKDVMLNDDAAMLIIDVIDDNLLTLSYDKIEISNLRKLQGKFGTEESNYLIENEVRKIEEKFHKSTFITDAINIQPNQSSNSNKIKKKSNKKKKKKGFWESKIQYLKNFISLKNTLLSENDLKNYSKGANKTENDASSGDIGSITDKF